MSSSRPDKKRDAVSYSGNIEEREPSAPVARRLSSPFNGLPSVVDYDPDTGYVTFGVLIPRDEREKKRLGSDESPGVCRHNYCLTERRRRYGLQVPSHPVGLPWASGLLKYIPGHVKVEFPLRRNRRGKRGGRPGGQGKKNRKKSLTDVEIARRCEVSGALEEMTYFYKMLILAGSVISEARHMKYGDYEEEEEETKPEDNQTEGAEKEGDSKVPQEPASVDNTEVVSPTVS